MKTGIMLKTKRYKFGFLLAKGEKVIIEKVKDSERFCAKNSKYGSLLFGVNHKDFRFDDEVK